MSYIPVEPEYVVVDTIDGYTYTNNGKHLFDFASAVLFTATRNAERKKEYRSYRMFRLVPVSEEEQDAYAEQSWDRYGGDGTFADNH